MLGISPRAARITWTIFVIAALLVFLYAIRSTVLVFMTAMFFAYVLWPLVALTERHLPRWLGRTMALTIVYLVFWGALVAILVTVGVHLFEQASSFAQNVQVMINKGTWLENLPSWLGPARDHIIVWIKDQFSSGSPAAAPRCCLICKARDKRCAAPSPAPCTSSWFRSSPSSSSRTAAICGNMS